MLKIRNASLKSRYLLPALLLCAALVACKEAPASGTDTKTTDPTDSAAVETAAETTPPYPFFEEELDYGGYNFRIFRTSFDDDGNEVDVLKEDIEGGDIVHEAVYERNMRVEELLNIEISEVTLPAESDDWQKTESTIAKNVMAGDDAYDAVCTPLIQLFKASSNSNLLDFNEIKTLDYTNAWWDKQLIEAFDFGNGKVYMLSGGINFRDDLGLVCMYFNRDLFAQNDFEDPYDAVRSGEWDFDMFYGYVKDFESDLNGNSEWDESDRYGYVTNLSVAAHIGCGMDMLAIHKDDAGVPAFGLTEGYYDRFSKIIDILCNDPAVVVMERKFGYEIGNSLFQMGNVLFVENLVESCLAYRGEVDFNLGVLPMPKYNESQENYMCSVSDAYSSAYGVPITNSDHDRTGYILDAMGYYGQELVYPAIIEKNVLVKGVHDQDSADMFNIIFNSKAYDLAYITGWGSWYQNLWDFVDSGKNNLASKEAAFTKRIVKDIEKSLAAFEIDGY